MKQLRALFTVLAACGMVGAHASFDLMLVADNNTTSGGGFAAGSVHRFDPVSGAYLGSFGYFENTIVGMAADKESNRCYVATTKDIFAFDYNTGDLITNYSLGSYTPQSLSISRDGSKLFLSMSGYVPTFAMDTATGGFYSFATNANMSQQFFVETGAGGYMSNVSSYGLGVYDSTAAYQGYYSSSQIYAMSRMGGGDGTLMVWSSGTSAGSPNLQVASTTSAGLINQLGASRAGTSMAMAASFLAPAHSGVYAMGYRGSSVWRIQNLSVNLNTARSFDTTILKAPVAIATVLAPEPAEWLVLGLGVAILIRKRRR